MNTFIKYIFGIFHLLPGLRKPIKSVELMHQIDNLEKNNQLEEARRFRKKAILKTPFKYRAPLLKSEGEDQLYRICNYKEALRNFEEAIDALQQCPALFGASSPDRIYAGAAIASIYTQQKEKAEKYYSEFSEIVEEFENSSISASSFKWHIETKAWLESQIFNRDHN
jgi:tetratricopeptide (TPR) repeat protein